MCSTSAGGDATHGGEGASHRRGALVSDELVHATFLATFPPILSSIKIHGMGEGMRVQLEIPESEMHEAVKLLQWRGMVIRVTVESELDKQTGTYGESELETRSVRKSEWQTT